MLGILSLMYAVYENLPPASSQKYIYMRVFTYFEHYMEFIFQNFDVLKDSILYV